MSLGIKVSVRAYHSSLRNKSPQQPSYVVRMGVPSAHDFNIFNESQLVVPAMFQTFNPHCDNNTKDGSNNYILPATNTDAIAIEADTSLF